MRFLERLAALGFKTYAEYLASDHWKGVKRRYRKRGRRMVCEVCGSRRIQLHHHNYSRLGKEKMGDLTPLCRGHHKAVHEWLKANGKPVNATCKAVEVLRGLAQPKKLCVVCKTNTAKRNHELCKSCRRKREGTGKKAKFSRKRVYIGSNGLPLKCHLCGGPRPTAEVTRCPHCVNKYHPVKR